MHKTDGMELIMGNEFCPCNDVMLMKITNGFLKKKNHVTVCASNKTTVCNVNIYIYKENKNKALDDKTMAKKIQGPWLSLSTCVQ
jgi:hypothetical protein